MKRRGQDVLIVDDDEVFCEEVADGLRDEGFGVEASHDGRQARRLLLRKRYDVVLLDLGLPGISGFDILSGLRRKRKHLQVIVITARHVASSFVRGEPSCDDEEQELYQTLSLADGILTKPFAMPELLSMMRQAADHPRPEVKRG